MDLGDVNGEEKGVRKMCKPLSLVAGSVCLCMATLLTVGTRAAGSAGQPVATPNGVAPAAVSSTTSEAAQTPAKLSLVPLGVVKRSAGRTFLVFDKKYAPGLVSVGDFSHVMVFYWCDRNDTPDRRASLQGYRQGKANPLTGVFATRSPVRPNPIAITTCKIIAVTDNFVEIDRIDAFDDSPIIDLKPYIPRNDCFPNARIPVWVQ
jgi:tRNA-Thr(GGU) m(6)t(6)A37 methyltransferase TsaA